MNSLERTRSAIRGESVDYTPNFPILIAPACQLVGVKLGGYFQDPKVMAETLIEARALCGFDGIYVSRDNWVYHEAMGGEMVFQEMLRAASGKLTKAEILRHDNFAINRVHKSM